MGITFRHDAAAVALPTTNASGRKYGQQLVLQQQQQKYATQQAQQDRMFDAYKMESQNIAQQQRDWQQRDFVLNRDRDQNKLQQQQMDAARQQQFMDDARKQQSGMIMADIQSGEYDPNTARKLQQNLVAESEALGNPQLDATQRAEALQKIRAERALLASNRMQKPPAPTPQEQFEQGVVNRNGVDYIQDSKGKWTPLEPSKSQQEQEKMQQQQLQQQEQEAQKMRPKSAQEYYAENEDKFQKDLEATMKTMQSEQDLVTDPKKKKEVTPEAAWEQMQKNHDFRQKALGKAQYGEPTLAPEAPKPFGQRLEELRSQSKSSGTREDFKAFEDFANTSKSLQALQDKIDALPLGSEERKAATQEWVNQRDRLIQLDKQASQAAPPEMKSIIDPSLQRGNPTAAPPASIPSQPVSPPEMRSILEAPAPVQTPSAPIPAQNAWEQVATPPATPTPEAPTEQGLVNPQANAGDASKYPWLRQPGQLMKGGNKQDANAPDFGSLTVNAADEADRQTIGKLQSAYEQAKSPEVKNAISILVNPKSAREDKMKAVRDLKKAGVDINQLTVPVEQGPGFLGSIPTGLGF